jgi:hypothetical protein
MHRSDKIQLIKKVLKGEMPLNELTPKKLKIDFRDDEVLYTV